MKTPASMTDDDRRTYIDGCQLADCGHSMAEHVAKTGGPVSKEDAPLGAVVGSNLLAFAEGVSRQNKEDIMDSFQFATMAANKMFNPETQSQEWYARFNKVLGTLGWFSTNWSYSRYRSTRQQFSMDQVGLEIIGSAVAAAALPGPASAAMLKVAGDALVALKAQEKPLRLFERQTKTHHGANFRIGACAESEEGTVSMAMGAVNFSANSVVTDVLFWTWNSAEVSTFRGEDMLVFNARAYARVRDQVQEKLNKSSASAITEFEI